MRHGISELHCAVPRQGWILHTAGTTLDYLHRAHSTLPEAELTTASLGKQSPLTLRGFYAVQSSLLTHGCSLGTTETAFAAG